MAKITLAELRKKNRLTQRELSKILDVSPATIGMYETGKRTPSLKKAIIIADLFDVQLENISFSSVTNQVGGNS